MAAPKEGPIPSRNEEPTQARPGLPCPRTLANRDHNRPAGLPALFHLQGRQTKWENEPTILPSHRYLKRNRCQSLSTGHWLVDRERDEMQPRDRQSTDQGKETMISIPVGKTC